MSKLKLMIDPPSGYMYGFPKEIPENVMYIDKWLLENGYPKEKLDEQPPNFYVRMWYEDENGTIVEPPKK